MKIYRSKVKQRKIDRPDKNWGILFYDAMNDYPQRITDIVNSSGTAKNCIRTYAKFIEGRGFNDKTFYKLIINKDGLTNDKLLRKLSFDLANRGGFAVHINYNANFKAAEFRHIPFSDIRRWNSEFTKHQNKYAVHPDWTGRMKRVQPEQFQWIDKSTPDPEVLQRQVDESGGWENYNGQLYWYSVDGENYPLAPYDAVIEDIETDGRIKSRRRKKAASDYAPDYWWIQNGEFESEEKRDAFLDNIESDLGDEGASIKLIELKATDLKPELMAVPQANAKTNYSIENETKSQGNIRKAFGMPSVLVGEDVAAGLGGLSSQMLEAYATYNSMTDQERRIMEETFKTLFENSVFTLPSDNDYSIIPQAFNTGNEKSPLAIQYGVGGTTSIKELLVDPTLSTDQKINTLIILFGLTEDQASAMVTGKKIPIEEQPE